MPPVVHDIKSLIWYNAPTINTLDAILMTYLSLVKRDAKNSLKKNKIVAFTSPRQTAAYKAALVATNAELSDAAPMNHAILVDAVIDNANGI